MIKRVINAKPGYETFEGDCPHCNYYNIYNRIDDLGIRGKTTGHDVFCKSCKEKFRLLGDTLEEPYKDIYNISKEFYQKKQYMVAISLLSQSLEMFLSYLIHLRLIHPYYKKVDSEIFELLIDKRVTAFRKLSFRKILCIYFDIIMNHNNFQSYHDTLNYFKNILDMHHLKSITLPKDDEIKKAKTNTSEYLIKLKKTKINEIRNMSVHKGYRPNKKEATNLFEDAEYIMIEYPLQSKFLYQNIYLDPTYLYLL